MSKQKTSSKKRNRDPNREDHFTIMTRVMMQTEAWQALSLPAQALYPWLRLEWKGPKHNVNGKISLSVRQAAERLGCDKKTAGRAFHDLQAKGFIVQTTGAHLGVKGEGKCPTYELTGLPLPACELNRGRKLYLKWNPDTDFEVKIAPTNNPSGRNGKSKSLTPNVIRLVSPRGTKF